MRSLQFIELAVYVDSEYTKAACSLQYAAVEVEAHAEARMIVLD